MEKFRSQRKLCLVLCRILDKNSALLGKWLWRSSSEHQSLWAVVICSKFGQANKVWTADNVKHSSLLSLWRGIIQVLPSFLPFTKLWVVAALFVFGLTLEFPQLLRILVFLVFSSSPCLKMVLSLVSSLLFLTGTSTFIKTLLFVDSSDFFYQF